MACNDFSSKMSDGMSKGGNTGPPHSLIDQPSTTQFYGGMFALTKDFFEAALVMIETLGRNVVNASHIDNNITSIQLGWVSSP